MAALTYNLKKLLNFKTNNRISVCIALKKQALVTTKGLFSTIIHLRSFMKHHTTEKIFLPYNPPYSLTVIFKIDDF